MNIPDLFRQTQPMSIAEVASRNYKVMADDIAKTANELDLQDWDPVVVAEIRRLAFVAYRASRAELRPGR